MGCRFALNLTKQTFSQLQFTTMKQLFILALCILPSFALLAQVEKDAKALRDSAQAALSKLGKHQESKWDKGASGTFLLNQVSLSNWQAGGQSSVSGSIALSFYANRLSSKWRWSNRLDMGYGQQWIEGKTVKTDDRFDLYSRADRILSKNWSASLNFNFRTQYVEGFENPDNPVPISTFLAPAYTVLGLGFTYSPSKNFSFFVSPLTIKHTFVNNQRLANLGAFGVEAAERDSNGVVIKEGKRQRYEVGAYVNAYFKRTVMTNITYESKLDLFSNYLNNPQNIDINWENGLSMKVNKYVTVAIIAHLIYDDDIIFNDSQGVGPRTQFKQSLGVGLSYKL